MRFSTSIIGTTLLILTSVLLNSSTQVNAYWTKISLRIEGSEARGTIFEGTVSTTGHIVTTGLGGTHECDGTNNGAHTTPGATITSAIDDAVSTWDGGYYKGMRDYLITSIDGDGGSWGLLVGYKLADKGGCQTQVGTDDKVLVALGAFSARAFLEARADRSAVAGGGEVTFTVVNGADGSPVQSATVAAGPDPTPSAITGADGKATITLPNTDVVYKYKARKAETIRSNEVVVTVIATVLAAHETMTMAGAGSQTVYPYDAGFRGCNQ